MKFETSYIEEVIYSERSTITTSTEFGTPTIVITYDVGRDYLRWYLGPKEGSFSVNNDVDIEVGNYKELYEFVIGFKEVLDEL